MSFADVIDLADVAVFVPRVTQVEIVAPYRLAVEFLDGSKQDVDVEPLLHGDAYGALRDPALFNRVAIDPFGSLAWPNGVTLSLWTLHDWLREGPRLAAQLRKQARTSRRLEMFRQGFAVLATAWFLWTLASWAGLVGGEPASARDVIAGIAILAGSGGMFLQKRSPAWALVLNGAWVVLYFASRAVR
jgi:hypothetical protein